MKRVEIAAIAVVLFFPSWATADNASEIADIAKQLESFGGTQPSPDQRRQQIVYCRQILADQSLSTETRKNAVFLCMLATIPPPRQPMLEGVTRRDIEFAVETARRALNEGVLPYFSGGATRDQIEIGESFLREYLTRGLIILGEYGDAKGVIDYIGQNADKPWYRASWVPLQEQLLRAQGMTEQQITAWFHSRSDTEPNPVLAKKCKEYSAVPIKVYGSKPSPQGGSGPSVPTSGTTQGLATSLR